MLDLDVEPELRDYFPHGFVVSARAWARFGMDALDAAGADLAPGARQVALARALANALNAVRDFRRPDVQPAHAGELLALGLLTDVFRHMIARYAAGENPEALLGAAPWIAVQAGVEVAERPVPAFCGLFPPTPVRTGDCTAGQWLSEDGGAANRERLEREMLLLHLSLANRAAEPYRDLFDDAELRNHAPWPTRMEFFARWLRTQPPMADTGMTLIDFLLEPLRAAPDSLLAQLEFIRVRWVRFLPKALLARLHVAQGVLREERRMRGFGPGPIEAPTFGLAAATAPGEAEYEAFSVDRAWMPNLVLIAKTVYVWLHQLSRQYGRDIQRLDQIPDEELDTLARRGFTGLWLIGLWERSESSRTIKVLTGNPEAAASAYSLYDYTIAHDLGGYDAYQNLAQRAWRRGVRLASDMVPNHVGIHSKWVVEHPDWFVQLDHPPFPGYTFNGPDLSPDGRVALHIEDGYWNRTDAAVVFRRIDRASGHTRYIYHGNDGTSMPWNDTAQLNYLIPEVREAVIQTILHVARQFPIIRFDAAMTLAKKHFQRLWFPLPGDGGAIPTRAEHGMSKEDFDRVFPVEFWREVVDRVAQEAPDTLLLAEAFWLMEGYFVRTLGMHRVYNSAFMNMLKMEENGKYRQTIKNVLEFSPEILQRFVNFMNNPDEDTAEAQFGKGDKYFGVCTLMGTMPGLPMFGHGQVEGYTEKYGMEYRRAYRDEWPEGWLVDRHEREIFPLLHRRHLFSGARNFALFDFETGGGVDENVFAYANRVGGERALIVYHNRFGDTRGAIRISSAINVGSAEQPRLERRSVADALALNTAPTCYYLFRDHRAGLEYLEHAGQIAAHGMPFDLGPYECRVLLDWREVHDFDHSWGRLHAELKGRGVPSVEEAFHEMHLAHVIAPLRALLAPELLRAACDPGADEQADAALFTAYGEFLRAVATHIGATPDFEGIADGAREGLRAVCDLESTLAAGALYPEVAAALAPLLTPPAAERAVGGVETDAPPRPLWPLWILMAGVGGIARSVRGNGARQPDPLVTAGAWLREWYLLKAVGAALETAGWEPGEARLQAALLRACLSHAGLLVTLDREVWGPRLHAFFHDPEVAAWLGTHHFGGRRWILQEWLDSLLNHLLLAFALARRAEGPAAADDLALALGVADTLREAAADCGYDLDATMDCLK